MGHLAHDECGEDAVRAHTIGHVTVEIVESGSDSKKKRELNQDYAATGKQGNARFGEIFCGKQTLDHYLIGTMTGHGQEATARQTCPEGIGLAQAEGKVKDGELAPRGSDGMDCVPTSRHAMREHQDAHDGACNIQPHLHHVGPDNSGHSALEGVDQGQQNDDGDRKNIASADRDADHDRYGEHANTFRRGAEKEEKKGCELVQARTEALTDDLIGGEKFSAKIAWKKKDADHDSAE